MPASATSEQKFQIIADTIHFDIINGVLWWLWKEVYFICLLF
jgi:hypothetical protein